MDRIDDLLEKYFRAETSLEEEKLLKTYFMSDRVKYEHVMYRPLFGFLTSESEITYPEKEIELQKTVVKAKKNIYIRWISLGMSAAAILLIAIMFIKPQYGVANDYAIVNGKYIDNEEYVMQIANSRIENVNDMLSRALKPVENITKVRDSLEPVRKLSEINTNK